MGDYILNDGTQVESITVEVDGIEYTGSFKIKKVGGGKSAFSVGYELMLHKDTSLFRDTDYKQMLMLAKSELKKMVLKSLARKRSE